MLEPEIKWRVISDFYQLKINMGKHHKVKHFFKNKTPSGTDISSDAGYGCEEVNRAHKRSRAPSETNKNAGKSCEKNYEK